MITIPQNASITHALGREVKQFLQSAVEEADFVKVHLAGRGLLLGISLAGIAEVTARLAFYCLAQVAAFLTLYQSDTLNALIKDQVQISFNASIITSASLFSLFSPHFFTTLHFTQDAAHNRPVPIARPLNQEQMNQQQIEREAQMVMDIIKLPFQMIALAFQLPFYMIQLSFNLMLLPIRIALLPFRIALMPLNIHMLSSQRTRLDLF